MTRASENATGGEIATLRIERDFRGASLPATHQAELRLTREPAHLRLDVDAPYFGDPAPRSAPGPTDRLWDYEVCELFIADTAQRYLEVELSPHGHHLVLELFGVRNVVRSRLPLDYQVHIAEDPAPEQPAELHSPRGRYRGVAWIPWSYLPSGAARVNAYLIHGTDVARCYHAHRPTHGEVADFHQLECFAPVHFG